MINQLIQSIEPDNKNGMTYQWFLNLYSCFTNMEQKDWNAVEENLTKVKEFIESHQVMAKLSGDEKKANTMYVAMSYMNFIKLYKDYWDLLDQKKYRESWDILQNCLNALEVISRFIENKKILFIEELYSHLRDIEYLYPFRIFASSEFLNEKETCSICKRDTRHPECEHIPGQLYFGEMAYIIVEKTKLLGVALVENPEDKRLVIEPVDDNTNADKKYEGLDFYFAHIPSPLHRFKIKETRMVVDIRKDTIGRNDKCPCSSGLKYKNCCFLKKDDIGVYTTFKLLNSIVLDIDIFLGKM